MLLTEEHAKEKWCPETRYLVRWEVEGAYSTPAVALTSVNTPRKQPLCIASGCMMWRFESATLLKCDGKHAQVIPCADPGCWLEGERTNPAGYCGLAGHP